MSCAVTRTRLPDLRTLPSRTWRTPRLFPTSPMWAFLPLKVNDELRAMTKSWGSLDSAVMMSSEMPVGEIFVLRIVAHVGEGQYGDRRLVWQGGMGGLPLGLRRRLRLSRQSDLQRINPCRLGDVLEPGLAEVADREIEPCPHLSIGVLGKADRARLGDPFEACGDIDAVAHEIPVGLLDYVAETHAYAEDDATILRRAGVALGQRPIDAALCSSRRARQSCPFVSSQPAPVARHYG